MNYTPFAFSGVALLSSRNSAPTHTGCTMTAPETLTRILDQSTRLTQWTYQLLLEVREEAIWLRFRLIQ